jgi:hypothetical protein
MALSERIADMVREYVAEHGQEAWGEAIQATAHACGVMLGDLKEPGMTNLLQATNLASQSVTLAIQHRWSQRAQEKVN